MRPRRSGSWVRWAICRITRRGEACFMCSRSLSHKIEISHEEAQTAQNRSLQLCLRLSVLASVMLLLVVAVVCANKKDATIAVAAAQTITRPAGVLRVCADPNNLPFSNERLEGFENKIAELLAHDLGERVEYTWW